MGKSFKTILVPVDFSEHAAEALLYAGTIAQGFGGTVLGLHVISREIATVTANWQTAGGHSLPAHAYLSFSRAMESTIMEDTSVVNLREQALEALLRFLPDALEGLSVVRRVAVGHPFACILETAAQESAELIVMGTHGRTGLAHLMLGSVAERVVRMAACPVLTVKAPSAPDASG